MNKHYYFVLGVIVLFLLSQNCSSKSSSMNQVSIGAKNTSDLKSTTSLTPESDLINQVFDTIYTVIKKDYCPIVTRYNSKICSDSFYVLDTLFAQYESYERYYQVFITPERRLDSLLDYSSNEITFTLSDNLKKKIKYVLLHNSIDFPTLKSKPEKIFVLLLFSHVSFNIHKDEAVFEVHVNSTAYYMINYIFPVVSD